MEFDNFCAGKEFFRIRRLLPFAFLLVWALLDAVDLLMNACSEGAQLQML